MGEESILCVTTSLPASSAFGRASSRSGCELLRRHCVCDRFRRTQSIESSLFKVSNAEDCVFRGRRIGMATTALTSCTYQPRFGISHISSLALCPCAGLRRNLSLNGKKQERDCSRGRIGIRRRRRVGAAAGVEIRAGLPVVSSVPVLGPLANAVFNPVLLFIVYAAGAFRFYSGFRKTTYADSSATKISMTALWPVLFVASKAYRSNFKKAVS
jgi:hypothetical protein